MCLPTRSGPPDRSSALECPPMTNSDNDPELHEDLLKIVAQQTEVTAAIQPALDAMEEGMAVLRTVCSLISDGRVISDSRLRSSALATFDSATLVARSPSFQG